MLRRQRGKSQSTTLQDFQAPCLMPNEENPSMTVPRRQGKKRPSRPRPWKRLAHRFNNNSQQQIPPSPSLDVEGDLAEATPSSACRLDVRSSFSSRYQHDNTISGDFFGSGMIGRRRSGVDVEIGLPSQQLGRVESALRHTALLAIGYIIGTQSSALLSARTLLFLAKGAEYFVVAWCTTLALMLLTTVGSNKLENTTSAPVDPSDQEEEEENDTPPTPPRRRNQTEDSMMQLLEQPVSTEAKNAPRANLFSHVPTAHSSLDPFYVIDVASRKRVMINSGEALELNTDYFQGQMIMMIRTPNVDDPSLPAGTPSNIKCSRYFAGKQRRFEIQFQIKLKRVPAGRVYFGTELHETVRMGVIQRAFVSAAMAFVKTTNRSFHYSLTGTKYDEDGNFEKPHMAFPVEEGMNRLVVTRPGETPPELGSEVEESADSVSKRKKGLKTVKWNSQDTYTLCLWSAYVDFLEWKGCNLPGIRPFSISNAVGRQSPSMIIYEVKDDESKYHNRSNLINIAELEMSHADESGAGSAAREWIQVHAKDPVRPSQDLSIPSVGGRSPEGDIEEYDDFLEYDETPDEDESESAAAELGEGIYVRSGDRIRVSEMSQDFSDACGFVSTGGGFAVLHEQTSYSVAIEKVTRKRLRQKRHQSSGGIIKNGDTVVIKLVPTGEHSELKYLSLHKGWWLKWVSPTPTKNGIFTLHTRDTTALSVGVENVSGYSTSSYLQYDGTFTLRHKRWSKYCVGVAREASPTYGGRLLGLHNPQHKGSADYHTEDDVLDEELIDGKRWIRPAVFQAQDVSRAEGNAVGSMDKVLEGDSDRASLHNNLVFSSQDCYMDVPAWVEMMNRSKRQRQLVYVVRVFCPGTDDYDEEIDEGVIDSELSTSSGVSFMRLRTGKDLSPVVRVGLRWRKTKSSPNRLRRGSSADQISQAPHNGLNPLLPAITNSPRRVVSPVRRGVAQQDTVDNEHTEESDAVESVDFSTDDGLEDIDEDSFVDEIPDSRTKGRKLIGKIAKSVKERTTTTGKKVVRQGVKMGKGTVKVGKGTVNVGKAIISGRPRQPPAKEPKSTKNRSRRKVERDLQISVSRRIMKRMERVEAKSFCVGTDDSALLAGELSAPEQSCHSVSSMLSLMSSVAPSSTEAQQFSTLLSAQIRDQTPVDSAFLRGGPVELGVTGTIVSTLNGNLVHGCIVARCLWESHWREEWCVLHKRKISFFAPLSSTPCYEISIKDIQAVRQVPSSVHSPLPGLALLAIETAWVCHYVAVCDEEVQVNLQKAIDTVMETVQRSETDSSNRNRELSNARLWQGLQQSLEPSLSSGKAGKWAEVQVSSQRTKRRIVLNRRRMFFDVDPSSMELHRLVENLLSTALSFSLDTLQQCPEAFSDFLDATCVLRGLSPQRLNLRDDSTFCLFVNIYHALLQHALLLSPTGPLQKKTCEEFMRTCCYEIGGDVFSLAELNNCVIRGKLARPTLTRPPYVEPPKKSVLPYRSFSLHRTCPSTHFLVNTGDVACLSEVPVLSSDCLAYQVEKHAANFLRKNVTVDYTKKIVTIPKICDIYKGDFCASSSDVGNASAALSALRFILRFMDEPVSSKIQSMLTDVEVLNTQPVTIRYSDIAEHYYSRLSQVVEPSDCPSVEEDAIVTSTSL